MLLIKSVLALSSVFLLMRLVTHMAVDHVAAPVAIFRGIYSDIWSAVLLAGPLSLLRKTWQRLAVVAITCGMAGFNLEHILVNQANLNFNFFHFLTDKLFWSGSAFSMRPIVFLMSFSMGGGLVYFVLEKLSPGRFKTNWQGVLLVYLSVVATIFFIPIDTLSAGWVQRNVLEDNILLVVNDVSTALSYEIGLHSLAPIASDNKRRTLNPHFRDLEGERLVPPQDKPNILLILIEGMAYQHLAKRRLPLLAELASETFTLPRFVMNQCQTNRGLYAILCGRYPNLIEKEAKADLVPNFTDVDTCLPAHLAAFGYRTVYLQSAPLSFMRKDRLMKYAGFSEILGEEHIPPSHFRGPWGVADRSLYEQAQAKLRELNDGGNPWFLTLLTVSTHHPYEIPDGRLTFEEAIRYADSAVVDFIESSRRQSLIENTLVIITADEASLERYSSDNMLWSNHGIFIADGPGLDGVRMNDGVFSQADFPISIMDYLGAANFSPELGGRSFFRRYDSGREIFFAHSFFDRFYSLNGDNRLIVCDTAFSCNELRLSGDYWLDPEISYTERRNLGANALERLKRIVSNNDLSHKSLNQNTSTLSVVLSEHNRSFGGQSQYVLFSHLKLTLRNREVIEVSVDVDNSRPFPVHFLLRYGVFGMDREPWQLTKKVQASTSQTFQFEIRSADEKETHLWLDLYALTSPQNQWVARRLAVAVESGQP